MIIPYFSGELLPMLIFSGFAGFVHTGSASADNYDPACVSAASREAGTA